MSGIFKANDIRGLYPSELDVVKAYRIGRGLANELHGPGEVIVCRDWREGSDELAYAISCGMLSAGRRAVSIGHGTSPMLYAAVNMLEAAGGVMVTASHNPAGVNGFKLVRRQAVPIGAYSGLLRIAASVKTSTAKIVLGPLLGESDFVKEYAKWVASKITVNYPHPVVIDAGNGAAGPVLDQVLVHQGIDDVRPMFFEPDARFPNHDPDPLVKSNLADLKNEVCSSPRSIGVAFDGDGDRVIFVDEDGVVVGGDIITAILAKRFLSGGDRYAVLYDQRQSRCVKEIIAGNSGIGILCKTGHAYFKDMMLAVDAIFGGELSGHYYFKDTFGCESGVVAMLMVLGELVRQKCTLAELVKRTARYAHSGEINFRVTNPRYVITKMKRDLTDGAVLSRVDGVKAEFGDWWFLVRKSNTEDVLRLVVEADTFERLHGEVKELTAFIEKCGGELV